MEEWEEKTGGMGDGLDGFKKALRGFSVETPKPYSGALLGDSVRILGVRPAVTPTFGLQL